MLQQKRKCDVLIAEGMINDETYGDNFWDKSGFMLVNNQLGFMTNVLEVLRCFFHEAHEI